MAGIVKWDYVASGIAAQACGQLRSQGPSPGLGKSSWERGWRGAVASWLVRSTPDQAVWVSALGHCVVLLGKTHSSHSASLHPGVEMGTGNI